jgi:chromosomal replication initiator protein
MAGTLPDIEWQAILRHFAARHRALVRRWFPDLSPHAFDRGTLTIKAGNDGQHRYLTEHCAPAFVEAAQHVTGRLVSVAFVDARGRSGPKGPDADKEPIIAPLGLNADYTFDTFVPGPSNQYAHANAMAVAGAPGQNYNPLFIHGDCGVGKTHLMQAVCHAVLDSAPHLRVAYLTCEMFINHYTEALAGNNLPAFRARYRQVDVLAIDDVQFLGRVEQTQEEFFHTFNTLYNDHKQILLSADSVPDEIESLEQRLNSRFKWGLMSPMVPPCLETRMAILRRKARQLGIELPDDVVLLIAERLRTNVRELEGALNRLRSHAEVSGSQLNVQTATDAIEQIGPPIERRVRVDQIIAAVSQRFGVKPSDLQSDKRSRSIVLPRQICMHLARRLTKHSLAEIGGFFGGRDHSTVLHADRTVFSRRNSDERLRADLDQMESDLLRGREFIASGGNSRQHRKQLTSAGETGAAGVEIL